MQDAAGLEPVRVGGDAAHRMHRHRPADHPVVLAAGPIDPGNVQAVVVVERRGGKLGGDAANGGWRDAASLPHRLGCMLGRQESPRQELEDGAGCGTVGKLRLAREPGRVFNAIRVGQATGGDVDREGIALLVAREQAGVVAHQPVRVRVPHEIVEIDAVGAEQLMDEACGEEAVGAGPDAHPFVGDRRVPGSDRVDRDDLGAARLEVAETDLDRVGSVVFGDAEQEEVSRPRPVGFSELPERAAKRVETGSGHVHGAETAMCGVVRCSELGRPPPRQGLRLVAAGEEGELLRILVADARQPRRRRSQRVLPLDLPEFSRTPLSHPEQRFGEPCRRVVLHDARRALSANNTLVHRMIAVAFDVRDGPVPQVDFDPATAGTHVAGGRLHLVPGLERRVDGGFAHGESW